MLLRSTLIYGPAILFTRICALLFIVIATRIIDQAEYGLLTLVVTVGETIDVAVSEWMRISLLRLGGKGDDVSRGSLIRAGGILAFTTMLALAIAVPASVLVVQDRWPEFLLAVCFYLVSGAVARLPIIVLQMQQRHSAYVILEFLRAVLQLVLPALIMMTDYKSFLAVSLAANLGTFMAGLVAGFVAARRVTDGPSRFTRREFFSLGLPIIAVAVVSFGLNSAERVILNAYHGATSVAVFAAIYALARQPISMIANAVNTASFPEAVARFDGEGPEAASRFFTEVMALIILLSLPAAALLVALNRHLVDFILPPDYGGDHASTFAIIAFAVILTNLTDFVYGAMIHAHKRPQLLIVNKIGGSVAAIGLSFWLIPVLSEIGAACALLGGALASLAISVTISRYMTPIALPWRAIASSALISAVTGGVAYAVAEALDAYHPFIRLAVAGTVSGFAFLAMTGLLYPKVTMEKLRMARARIPLGRRAG